MYRNCKMTSSLFETIWDVQILVRTWVEVQTKRKLSENVEKQLHV